MCTRISTLTAFVFTQIMDFVKSREDFISQFLNHLGTSAMMDLLLQMVAAPENDKNRIELAEVSFLEISPSPLFLSPLSLSLSLSLFFLSEVMLCFSVYTVAKRSRYC